VSLRASLTGLAKRGIAHAIKQLQGPDVPEVGAYLLEWHRALHGRSGITMEGVAPLSWTTLQAWADLTGVRPTPDEVTALLFLDDVRLAPEILDEKE
jgi:hypothetical protein